MKYKISFFAFMIVFSSVLFSQKNKNEKTIDSIIIEVTKNYANINSDEKIQEASKNCYEEFIGRRDTSKTFLENYGELLEKYDLLKIKKGIFSALMKIKQNDPNLNLGDFLISLKEYSKKFESINYPKEKIFLTDELSDKYKSRISNVNQKPSKKLREEAKYEFLSIQNLLTCLLVIFLIIVLLKNKKLKETLDQKEKKIYKLTQKKAFTNDTQETQINALKRNIKQLEEELRKPSPRNPESSNELNNEIDHSHQNEKISVSFSKSGFTPSTFYFRQPSNDGNFKNELKIDDFEPSLSMFKITITSDLKSTFEYCGDSSISKLISNNPNTHLGLVCDFVNTSDQYNSRIENIAVGKAELKNDIWIVTQKARIKFS
jgi:hypothetical protein